MRIVNILFKVHFFRLIYTTAAAGIIVLFFCSPLWGYIPDLLKLPSPVLLSDDYLGPLSDYLCKRGSRDQNFQQWQDLSPQDQEKLRKKYREWQSLSPEEQQIIRQRMHQLNRMPSQKRKLYKQLFRQWQDLPPQERNQLQDDLDNWEHLSPRQRDSIRRRFNN
jgi:mRNA-degrading endonuclease RelE of RelBE toxin-antitoxin system